MALKKPCWALLLFAWALLVNANEAEPVFSYGENLPDLDPSLPAIRFVGDRDYPPIEWLEDGQAKGIFPSILPALAQAINRRIEYRLTDWKQAQQMVKAGQADVLTVFSPNSERIHDYDFVPSFLEFEMSLFVTSDNVTIHGLSDVKGLKVGVPKGSFLIDTLNQQSKADIVEVPDHQAGFEMLLAGQLSAFATNKWVGTYSIQKMGLTGIKFVKQPILTKPTHLGLKKGNDQLAKQLNSGVQELKLNGTIARLTQDWEKLEVIYLTQGRLENIYVLVGTTFVGLLLLISLFTIVLLKRRVKQKTHSLVEANQRLEQTLHLLQQTQEQLVQSQKIASLNALVVGLSHEINTPLGNAITLSSLFNEQTSALDQALSKGKDGIKLKQVMQISGQLNENTELLNSILKRLASLVNSFRSVALTQGDQHREKFDLAILIQQAVDNHSIKLEQQGVIVQVNVAEPIVLDSYCDSLALVLDHLVQNALVHGFAQTEQPQLTVNATLGNRQAIIEVADNGSGIPADDLPKLFDPFFTTSLGKGSSGLGMYIVYTLVTGLLGGQVKVTSEQGCQVKLTLPLCAPEAN
ncbi:ATP-binding protein [Motilimonas eburnea]|uniref:ATP-binding protein n=1 Tax=Motilimonas eburnea TaxID=1737488 RepID=UPI001E31D771|nr:transporter substrate-binding domain-containing protein [Motilimonas eburnea]MCE2571138.1 transporter substrate-binding domain-containing protein [Motilimonas eburnea]